MGKRINKGTFAPQKNIRIKTEDVFFTPKKFIILNENKPD